MEDRLKILGYIGRDWNPGRKLFTCEIKDQRLTLIKRQYLRDKEY